MGDSEDVFPLDPTEWLGSDGDGVGDNSDAFPADPTEFSPKSPAIIGVTTSSDGNYTITIDTSTGISN